MKASDILIPPSQKERKPAEFGFGAMRLPSGRTDVRQMIYMYMDGGFNYFDTAYVYDNSEEMLKKELVARHARESFLLADKIPPWLTRDAEQNDKLLRESLSRCGVDYFDFYLVHSLDSKNLKRAEAANVFEWIFKQKKKGYCRHVGFSFHGDAEQLEYIFLTYPQMEFVQLQLNYADVLRGTAGELHRLALEYDKPVIVMSPIKGGTLSALPPKAEAVFKSASPDATPSSFAMRYAASLAGVTCVLSGVSSLNQVHDNMKTFSPLETLTAEEYDLFEKVLVELSKTASITCTGCKYCHDDCPKQIDIAVCFSLYNESKRAPDFAWNRQMVYHTLPKGRRASDCNACGACIERCPQHIDVPSGLKEVAETFK